LCTSCVLVPLTSEPFSSGLNSIRILLRQSVGEPAFVLVCETKGLVL
jgi:hypothetical protein